jgi:NTP pyrophosphatase (non-canonical NTP hydrolase)
MGDDMIARDLSLVFVEITDERTRQDAKWGGVPGLERRDDHTYAAVLGEEFGEVCKAWLERDTDALRAELIQTAAVAVAWVEELDNGGMAARP